MKFHRIYALSIRHLYLIKSSFPRILDLIYWPTIQILLWGFISQFFTMYSDYYNNTIGVILSCAILYDFLFRSSISFNMLFLEEIWSRNFTNLFIAPLFNQEFVERELNAVNSEHKKNWGDDDWRLRMILKTQFSKNHAARKFSTGDAQTLSQVKRDELIEFYQKNYSANQMKLVLMSCESLENMESWATDFFSAIKNQQRQKHTYPSQVFDTEKLPMKVEVKSVADPPF